MKEDTKEENKLLVKLERAINITPTGELRNFLTDLNILLRTKI